MSRRVRMLIVLSLAGLALVAGPLDVAAQVAPPKPVTMEWLGWSHFRFTTPSNTVVLINPFTNNPDSPLKAADITAASLIFAADGHGDEQGSTVEIAQATGATVLTPGGVRASMIEQGLPMAQTVQASPGDRVRVGGVTARMVPAIHGSELARPSATVPYGGIAAGVILTFENGYTVYFAGSTAVMAEQAIWAELYKPHLAILHMGQSHDPLDFAAQARNLRTNNPNLDAVMPHHHRPVQPPGATSIAEVRAAMDSLGVSTRLVAPEVSRPYSLIPYR